MACRADSDARQLGSAIPLVAGEPPETAGFDLRFHYFPVGDLHRLGGEETGTGQADLTGEKRSLDPSASVLR